jgi:acyl-CoA synthetase (AMP-forming)/AMP-acid ligase II
MIIDHALRLHARYRPQKTAIVDPCRTITYRALDRMVDHTARALIAHGAGFGKLVGVSLLDSAEYLIMLLALGRVGAVMLPMDPRWALTEAQAMAKSFEADMVLFNHGDGASAWMRVSDDWFSQSDEPYTDARIGETTPMLLSLSSGTTGMPKGPLVSHGQFVARFTVYWLDLSLSGQDRFITATPLYFGGGRGFALAMIYAGGVSCLLPPPYSLDELLAFAEQTRASAMFLVPTQLRRLLELDHESYIFPYLRVLISSGAALFVAEQRAVRTKLTPNLFQYYSSTEGGGCSVLTPAAFDGHPDSVGQPLFGVEVEIVGDDHKPKRVGEKGRLRYRSAASATAYYKGDGSAAFHDGWFYPGDLGSLDDEGFLYLSGRSKDMIIRGGVNIYPGDIEQVLAAFEEVYEAAVIGQPSREFGEDIVAFIVASKPIDESVLRDRCGVLLARYKVPKTFLFVDSLPKTSMGKVLKVELVRMLEKSA